LNRIGHVLHVSNTKNIIVKAENLPRIGDEVVNEKLNHIGIVFDVFGPTKSPYVAVKPKTHDPKKYLNHLLYSNPSKLRKGDRRKR
jgi:RNA-binding protein